MFLVCKLNSVGKEWEGGYLIASALVEKVVTFNQIEKRHKSSFCQTSSNNFWFTNERRKKEDQDNKNVWVLSTNKKQKHCSSDCNSWQS